MILLLTISLLSYAQEILTGRILSSQGGQPLSGATISIKNGTVNEVADVDGKFRIAAKIGDVLTISNAGFQTKEINISSLSALDITLVANTDLDAVVITGYSAQRKKDITGSVSVVDMKQVRAIPAGSAAQGLQGQASGVNVISSGAPGGVSTIFIRGITSFGNTQPLIIVDGIQSSIDNIAADEVESIQVLKDAGAAAIYGVRGSNGVIVITTKKGKAGKTTFSYDAYAGMQLPLSGNPFNLLEGEEYARVSKIAFPTSVLFANGLPDYTYTGPGVSGVAAAGSPPVDISKYNLDLANSANNYLIQKINKQGTNWFQEVFDPALITSHTLGMSGGTEKATFMASFNYFNQQGTLKATDLVRYSGRINSEFKINKNIRVGENVFLFYRQNRGYVNLTENQAIQSVIRIMPIIPVYDIAGNYGGTFAGPSLGDAENPVAQQSRSKNNRNHSWNVIGNVYAEVDFLQDFTVRTSFGGNLNNTYNLGFFFPPYNNSVGNSSSNSLSEASAYNSNTIWTNTLNYNKDLGRHRIKAMVGTEAIRNYGRRVSAGRNNFFSTDFNYLVLGNGTSNISNTSSAYENTLFSIFGRLDYTFDDKYLLAATIRRDGSSVFGSESRYGTFPSVSVGWRISNEKFMAGVNWINDLKLRASYGILGSQNNINPNNAYTLFGGSASSAYYDITGSSTSAQQGFALASIGNPNTSWEENIVTNIGLDATLFNKLDINVEYFRKSIKGLLFPQPIPAVVGLVVPPIINIGDIRNTGVDLAFNYRGSINRQLHFNAGANITTYKNSIIEIPGPGFFDAGTSRIGNLIRNKEGESVSSFFGYDVIGLFQSADDVAKSPLQDGAAPGRFKYRDVNNDGKVTPDDRVIFGDPNPDFTYGINLGFNYKNFDLSAIFYGSHGNEIINQVRWWTEFYSTFTGAKSKRLLNAWTPNNTNTDVPIVEAASSLSNSGAPNSYYLENGSYFRMRSLSLGYNIRAEVLKKAGISNLRIYLQGTNLFTITKYSGLDPEIGGSSSVFGVDYGNYPNNQKTFLFGINASF